MRITASRNQNAVSELRVARIKEWDHPSYYVVKELAEALNSEGFGDLRVSTLLARIVRRVGPLDRFVSNRSVNRDRIIITPLMGPRWDCLAIAKFFGEPIVYAWDIWEPQVEEWVYNLRKYDVEYVFGSSTAAGELLSNAGFSGRYIYLPEATNPFSYRPGADLVERPIKLLELGRRYGKWHDIVTPSVSEYVSEYLDAHLFERSPGELIFPTKGELVTGFSSSAVSICFPRSVTHPENAGSVPTFTHRYLESMSSRCLMVGHCPKDLEELFGYNPVIEVDWRDPAAQIIDILSRLSDYQELVNSNYTMVQQVGSWDDRARSINGYISEIDSNRRVSK